MPKKNRNIPVVAAKRIAQDYGKAQVIILAYEAGVTFVTTYGKTEVDCDQAAVGAERLKKFMKWDEIVTEPPRVKRYRSRIEKLTTAATDFLNQIETGHDSVELTHCVLQTILKHRQPGPMCRDCADNDGICPGTQLPCNPDEALAKLIIDGLAARFSTKSTKARLSLRNVLLQKA